MGACGGLCPHSLQAPLEKGLDPQNFQKYCQTILSESFEIPKNFFLPCLQGEVHFVGCRGETLHLAIACWVYAS